MAQECVGEGAKSAQASEVMAGDKEFLRLKKNAIPFPVPWSYNREDTLPPYLKEVDGQTKIPFSWERYEYKTHVISSDNKVIIFRLLPSPSPLPYSHGANLRRIISHLNKQTIHQNGTEKEHGRYTTPEGASVVFAARPRWLSLGE
jgi:hypothetical protein